MCYLSYCLDIKFLTITLNGCILIVLWIVSITLDIAKLTISIYHVHSTCTTWPIKLAIVILSIMCNTPIINLFLCLVWITLFPSCLIRLEAIICTFYIVDGSSIFVYEPQEWCVSEWLSLNARWACCHLYHDKNKFYSMKCWWLSNHYN